MIVLLALTATILVPTTAVTAADHDTTKERVTWWWESSPAIGRSVLARDQRGLQATMSSTGLTPGDAVTFWIIMFNNPDGCSTSPCAIPADVLNPDAGADFYWAGGAVVGPSGRATLRGTLEVGQVEHSGKAETGLGDPVALANPAGAEVVLALHSHGPAATGALLRAQLSTYLGGCEVFNGPDGFAAGPADRPDAAGECSTVQRSTHR